ncbi:NUDIX hydrolase [Pseudonocardia humida]|uniref:NUDIX hydrolase n=1 Tax=Pseudonocardia humida TaxID=2800819 RepID=UPI00207C63FE|nr:NUDIX domain-containing protein [Pseudonocardia humida]
MQVGQDAAAEPVALFDAAGRVVGVAPRGVVYRDGLWHGATGVLVRSGDGERVYVHRRSADKLVFPGAHDCWAGGVIGPGESPEDAAARELAEELGVRGVPLQPIERFAWDGFAEDAGIRCHTFTYEVRWDGPLHHQPEEVVWGAWVTLDGLRAMLADPMAWPFVPDGRVGIQRWFALRGEPLAG